jgi:hypothetical protein
MHLESLLKEVKHKDQLKDQWEFENEEKMRDLQETLETFIELHLSTKYKQLVDTVRVRNLLSPFKSSDEYDHIVQAVAWARKQGGQQGQGPNEDEALDLPEFTQRLRLTLERMLETPLPDEDARKLRRFYGDNHFKCPRINCYRYHNGFQSAKERNAHIDKHERPFLCYVQGCYMQVFGHATLDELREHLCKLHGINTFNEEDYPGFTESPKAKTPKNAAKVEANIRCPICAKGFTRNHNLRNHLRTHNGEKPFACTTCSESFTRKSDRDRHERTHGEKTYQCHGTLENGESWGCGQGFTRLDKLTNHFYSKRGRQCLRPLLDQKNKERERNASADSENIFANEGGENGEALRAAGRSLPRFAELLRMLGLDENGLASDKRDLPSP